MYTQPNIKQLLIKRLLIQHAECFDDIPFAAAYQICVVRYAESCLDLLTIVRPEIVPSEKQILTRKGGIFSSEYLLFSSPLAIKSVF